MPAELLPLKARMRLGVIGVLMLLAIGLFLLYLKIDAEAMRTNLALTYLSSQIDSVRKDVKTTDPSPTQPTGDQEQDAPMGTPFTLQIGQSVNLLGQGEAIRNIVGKVTLNKITDSRCKPGVQCIWAGELGADLTLTNAANQTKEIHVGKIAKACDEGITLTDISETSATFEAGLTCE